MAVVPNKKDVNYEAEVARMHKMAKEPDGKEKIKSEFGIDLKSDNDLPRKGSGGKTDKPSPSNTGK